MYNLVIKMEDHIWDDGRLRKEDKELIAIAIAAALRDQHAVRAQLMGAASLESPRPKSKRRSGSPSCSRASRHMFMARPSLTKS